MTVAHELAHWILDRGESGFVAASPWGEEEVEWYDEDGEPDEVSPEHRAEGWAGELLLPERMLTDDLPWDAPMTFRTIRDLGRLYRTPLLTTALRAVAETSQNAAVVRSRLGEPAKCLRRTDALFDAYLNEEPGPGTVAHGLLRGSREAPGPTPVGSDGWLYFNQAWWTTVMEDSLVTADGEVLSLLWWPGEAITEMVDAWPHEVLPPEPGKEAVEQLVRSMGRDWRYYPVEWSEGRLVMETGEPSLQRMVIPEAGRLDVAGTRGLVGEVARQKEVEVDEVVTSVADWDGYREL